MRIGQKIKSGLRLGAKVVGGALTAGAIGYLGYKGYEHKGRLDKVAGDNLLAQSFESMSPEQLDAFIGQSANVDLGPNYGGLALPPPPPVPVPIGQQFIAGPTNGNPSFGAKVEALGQKGVNVGQGIQTGEKAVGKVKNFFGFGG
tara:strand:+ start:1591 stop:2025 length:435 start_codon:yes stop_codon:yes gene_type:complete